MVTRTGSGLVDYQRTGAVCGVELPPDLVDGSRLPDPIFTPATKAAIGDHDENIDFAAVEATVGASTAEALRRVTLAVYTRAEGLARSRGLLLADTKFEFGRTSDKPDEWCWPTKSSTPDSSRWWPVRSYEPGRAQPSFDKQFVRDWLTSPASGWDKNSGEQPPQLPDEIVDRTRAKYIEGVQSASPVVPGSSGMAQPQHRFAAIRTGAIGFAIGSVLFATGALTAQFDPSAPQSANLQFVIGALFFTGAAAVQAWLAPETSGGGRRQLAHQARDPKSGLVVGGGAVHRDAVLQRDDYPRVRRTVCQSAPGESSDLASRCDRVGAVPDLVDRRVESDGTGTSA